MRTAYQLWLMIAWTCLASCAVIAESAAPAIQQVPGDDEWYRPPKGFENKKSGAILKYRNTPRVLSINNKDALKINSSWQILYRTQNMHGTPEASTVTVAIGNNADYNKVFMYHWFSDAGYKDCVPSLGMQAATRKDNTYTQVQNAIVLIGLHQGWVTIVVDDGGLNGDFGVSKSAAYRNIDAIKAVRASGSFTGIAKDAKLATLGYSGGAFGGELMAELQPSYAPDLQIDGMALGGLIPNITQLLTWPKNNRTSYAPPVLMSMARENQNFSTWLEDALKPEMKEKYHKSKTQCYDSNWNDFAGLTFAELWKNGNSAISESVPASVISWSSWMGGVGTPKIPLYIFESAGDDVSPIGATDDLLTMHCANGANIMYERNPRILNHSTEFIEGLPGAMRFVADTLEGKKIPPGCTNLTQTLYSKRGARQGFTFIGLLDVALGFFGASVGPAGLTSFLTKFPV